MLKQFLFVLWLFILSATFCVLPGGQDSQAQKAFAGTWEGKFKGKVFCVLELETSAAISGTFSPGRISVDNDGEITEAEPSTPPGSSFPILHPKLQNSKLSFEWKEDDDQEVLRFEMKLIGQAEAELQFVGVDNPIKPIHLHRK
ncbi:MAG TPA: hypothetical protein VJN43_20315 [Bryobacteraceae bacterium]|nr:hypothetical protein [Bryobacteraceae bacterium]